MSCIHTGAIVYFENYGFRSPCDVYRVGDCYLFRWNDQGRYYEQPREKDWKVGLIIGSDQWWHRNDLGITVVPCAFVTPGSR